MNTAIDQLKYPIGKYRSPEAVTYSQVEEWIRQIEELPDRFRNAASGLTKEQLDTPYREGGWSLRQVIHHVPDSHLNAYIRYKLVITEDEPIIRPYMEDRWSECADSKFGDIALSLDFLDLIHKKWVYFMRVLKPADFERTYIHPEHNKTFSLKNVTGMYAWHGEHHLHHLLTTRQRFGW